MILSGSSLSGQTCSSSLQLSNQDHCPIFTQSSWESPSFSIVLPCPPIPQMSSAGEGKKKSPLPSFGLVAGALQMSLIRERWTREKAYKFDLMLIFMWPRGLLRKEVKALKKWVGLRAYIPFLTKSHRRAIKCGGDKTKERVLKTSRGCKLWKSKYTWETNGR